MDFSILQNELKGKSTKIALVAFDLLYLNGYDLRTLPAIERKTHLKKIIDGTEIQFSGSFEIDPGLNHFARPSTSLRGPLSVPSAGFFLSRRISRNVAWASSLAMRVQ
jgi:bifunctional non-homologous end joining protein LigD